MRNLTFLLLLMIVFSSTANAQDKLSLTQCINIAKSKNISLQQAQLSLASGKIQLDQSKTNRLPNLNGSGGHNYNFGRSIDPFTNQFVNQSIQSNSFSLSTNVTLFNGFQLQNTIKQNENNLRVAEKDLEVLNNNISLSVATLYLQILLNEEQLKNSLQQKTLTEAQLKRARQMYEAGNVSRSAVVNLEAQMSNDDMNIVNAKNTIRNAYAQMATLLQITNYEDFTIENPALTIPSNKTPTIEQIIEKSLLTMPEIERDNLKMKSSLIGLEIAKGAYYPRLSLFGSVNTVYSQSRKERYDVTTNFMTIGVVESTNQNVISPFSSYKLRTTPFGQQLSDNFGQGIGLSLSVPIYNNNRIKNNIALSKINYQNNQLGLQNTEQQLKNEIVTAYANYENANAQYTASLKNEAAQKLNYEFTNDRFEAGLLNSVELLNAKNQWSNAQINASQAKFEYVFRKLILDFYQGNPLSIK
jgi:outer membrane protein